MARLWPARSGSDPPEERLGVEDDVVPLRHVLVRQPDLPEQRVRVGARPLEHREDADGRRASAAALPIDGITAEYTCMVNATVLCPSRSETAFG